MQSNMSVEKSSKISKCVKNSFVAGVVKKKNIKIIKKDNLPSICCGLLRGNMMTMTFRGMTRLHQNM